MEDEFAKALDALHTSVDNALHTKANVPIIKIETNPWTKPPEAIVVVPPVVMKSKTNVADYVMPALTIALLAFGCQYVYAQVQKPRSQTVQPEDKNETVHKQELPDIDLQYLAAIKTQQEIANKPREIVAMSEPVVMNPPIVMNPFVNPTKNVSQEKLKTKGFFIQGDIPQIDSVSEDKVVKESSDKVLSQAENDQIAEQMAKRREQQMLEQERLRQEAESQNLLNDSSE